MHEKKSRDINRSYREPAGISDHPLRTLAKILARQAAREWYEGQISPDLDVFPPPPDRKLPP